MTTALLLMTALAAGKAKSCEIPSEPVRWVAAVCMAQVGTDDLESEEVQKCMSKLEKKAPKGDDCKISLHWKKEYCKALAKNDKTIKVEACAKDAKMIP